MKVKNCPICHKDENVMYRVKINIGTDWIFVCKTCCLIEQKKENYKYGGTWKRARH